MHRRCCRLVSWMRWNDAAGCTLSNDTYDSFLRLREIGRAKDFSTPLGNYLTLAYVYNSISRTPALRLKTGGAWNQPPISIHWFQKSANSTRRFSKHPHRKTNSLSSAVVHNAYRFTGKRPIHMYVRMPHLYFPLVEGEIDTAHYYHRLVWKCLCVG